MSFPELGLQRVLLNELRVFGFETKWMSQDRADPFLLVEDGLSHAGEVAVVLGLLEAVGVEGKHGDG